MFLRLCTPCNSPETLLPASFITCKVIETLFPALFITCKVAETLFPVLFRRATLWKHCCRRFSRLQPLETLFPAVLNFSIDEK